MSYKAFDDFELKFIEENVYVFDDVNQANELMHNQWKVWQIRVALRFFDQQCDDPLFDLLDPEIVNKSSNWYERSDMTNLIYPGNCGTVGICMFRYTDKLDKVVLEPGILTIQQNAFYKSSLKSVVLPNTLKSIDGWAFAWCVNLTEVNIPDSVEQLDNSIFNCCKGLTKIKFPKSIARIPYQICNKCDNLVNVKMPDNCKVIGQEAFMNCTSLETITIPDGVEEIGEMAFFNTGIKVLEIPQSVKWIGKHIIGEWREGSNGWYATSNKSHKFKIRGLNKAEAREFAQNNIRFANSTTEAEFIRKLT